MGWFVAGESGEWQDFDDGDPLTEYLHAHDISDDRSSTFVDTAFRTLVYLLLAVITAVLWRRFFRQPPGSVSTSRRGAQSSTTAPSVAEPDQNSLKSSKFKVSLGLQAESVSAAVLAQHQKSLEQLCSSTQLFCIVTVSTEEDEKATVDLFRSLGLFSSGLKEHRVMFCRTEPGRVSMIRQLKSNVHLDVNLEVTQELAGKVPNVILVDLGKADSEAAEQSTALRAGLASSAIPRVPLSEAVNLVTSVALLDES